MKFILAIQSHSDLSYFLAHGWRSHAMGFWRHSNGTRSLTDSLTHSLTHSILINLLYSLRSNQAIYSYLPYLVFILFQVPFLHMFGIF